MAKIKKEKVTTSMEEISIEQLVNDIIEENDDNYSILEFFEFLPEGLDSYIDYYNIEVTDEEREQCLNLLKVKISKLIEERKKEEIKDYFDDRKAILETLREIDWAYQLNISYLEIEEILDAILKNGNK